VSLSLPWRVLVVMPGPPAKKGVRNGDKRAWGAQRVSSSGQGVSRIGAWLFLTRRSDVHRHGIEKATREAGGLVRLAAGKGSRLRGGRPSRMHCPLRATVSMRRSRCLLLVKPQPLRTMSARFHRQAQPVRTRHHGGEKARFG
jgi:hypothetical protein